ncbi:hypothetical protein [Xenorhabdus szentirmaii]|uniref:Uncharacterized protein n=1 Tax=Xenorhabdus szentirmaii TaxID=290112 RepID=A0AAW3YST9_9GAMM|nr:MULTISPECIES: hypothetical protein [Xenorhabdus]MBD2793727.1 hypothetical protein [Xenorhabdus sp. CUL]MBD2801200.1 hypothetical protein [Xenorhabdus sp. M]MBD2805442.1 hypothetical protein [Xenorhabdus sp. ZM]MBD2822218.1 hypothetical protein [Xenorhabdus sp. 42]
MVKEKLLNAKRLFPLFIIPVLKICCGLLRYASQLVDFSRHSTIAINEKQNRIVDNPA